MEPDITFDIALWMQSFIRAMQGAFGRRLLFVGLQGSRARGEAHAGSDIDTVVILDTLSAEDIAQYRAAVAALPHRALLCGFLSGAQELHAWDRADLFQFYHDTLPYWGALEPLLPPITEADARRAVHTAACALYHACCHNMTHARSMDVLRALYKSARFLLQAKYFCESGTYLRGMAALAEHLSPAERIFLTPLGADAFEPASAALLAFAGNAIRAYET